MAPMFPATVVFSLPKPLKYFLNLSIQLVDIYKRNIIVINDQFTQYRFVSVVRPDLHQYLFQHHIVKAVKRILGIPLK
jgi:hypothetical protein